MKNNSKSLEEVHSSVQTLGIKSRFRKFLAFMGPAYLVSVGYMDPGNWATDIAAGSQFGYRLIWVLLMSNMVAMLLQSFSARLGLVRGLDLAQASRQTYPKTVNLFLYILAEIAIAACDLAEVLGMAIGLNLLFGIPLIWGVVISVLDTILLLFLLQYGIKKIEAFIISLVVIISMCFFVEIFFASPDFGAVAAGFIPSLPNNTALYLAIGIIGATIMPHNLYLHSSLVQSRHFDHSDKGIKQAIRFNVFDSVIALNFAFLVNAAILILAGTVFYSSGLTEVSEIQDAHRLLEPLLGTQWAPILFAIALIAAGQSSTITGTLAGQVVMEGYLNLRIQPWVRRIITRTIAIVPALITILIKGDSATGDLLVFSQVILSLQLGFAVIPLLHLVSDKKKMGVHAVNKFWMFFGWISAAIIVGLNGKMVFEAINDWFQGSSITWWMYLCAGIAVCTALLLIYVIVFPMIRKEQKQISIIHNDVSQIKIRPNVIYNRIAVTVDFSNSDTVALGHAVAHGGEKAEYLLIHVSESAAALVEEQGIYDAETKRDTELLEAYRLQLSNLGYQVSVILEHGDPKRRIPIAVNNYKPDLLVMGAHGHKGLWDLIFGTTLDAVRHRVDAPVLIVRA